ncbi:MAG: hypothetical protein IJ757_09470 [Clostridiales bacterium]|nr:hypothetical protein [Clostridiales bacterium]
MRSEERAGIVAAVLLLLWGTILTFPLHEFTVFIEGAVSAASGGVLRSAPLIVVSIIKIAALAALEVLLLLLSRTGFAYYIPVCAQVLTASAFILHCIRTRSFDGKTGIVLGLVLAVTAVIYLLRAQRVLLWAGDLFIYAISLHLITSLIAAPLAATYPTMNKLLYINSYHDTDLSGPFAGFLTLPAFVWGLFFTILLTLPVIYYSFSRKKA